MTATDRQQGLGADIVPNVHPLLCPQSVNEVLESMESPLELVEGFVGSIEVAVPWAALLTDHCTVRVAGLQLTLQPRQSPGEGTGQGKASGLCLGPGSHLCVPRDLLVLPPTGPVAADSQSWASCMTSSLQLAQECLRDGLPEPSEAPQPLEGLEMFAQTIETGEPGPPPAPHSSVRGPQAALRPPARQQVASHPAPPDVNPPHPPSPVLRRIKVTFLDTVVRVEHLPGDRPRGVAVEVHVQR